MEVTRLCVADGVVPQIHLSGPSVVLNYPPVHLRYIVFELLANAITATDNHHRAACPYLYENLARGDIHTTHTHTQLHAPAQHTHTHTRTHARMHRRVRAGDAASHPDPPGRRQGRHHDQNLRPGRGNQTPVRTKRTCTYTHAHTHTDARARTHANTHARKLVPPRPVAGWCPSCGPTYTPLKAPTARSGRGWPGYGVAHTHTHTRTHTHSHTLTHTRARTHTPHSTHDNNKKCYRTRTTTTTTTTLQRF